MFQAVTPYFYGPSANVAVANESNTVVDVAEVGNQNGTASVQGW